MGKDTYSPQLKPAKLYWFTKEGIAVLAVRSVWRYWITGRELRGDGDNATYFHDATQDHRGRPYEKLTRARWRRVARRWAFLGWPLVLTLATLTSRAVRWFAEHAESAPPGWSTWPWAGYLAGYLIVLGCAGSAWAGSRFMRWWPMRTIRRELLKPAAEVLLRLSGVKLSRRKAMALIELPPGYGSAPEPGEVPKAVRVYMPAAIPLNDTRKAEFTRELGQRLGLPNAQGSWTVAAERAYVDLTPAPLPPAEVALADIRAEVEAAPLERPVLGMANGRRVVNADFDNDSPHTLGSAGSGAGKSTLYRWMAMQRMRHGAGAIFLDFKKWSHLRWLRGLGPDRVLYFHRIPEIHNALTAVMNEIEQRKDLDHEEDLERLRTLDVYVEEINTLMGMLRDYWRGEVARAKSNARSALRVAKAAEDEEAILDAEEELARANGLPVVSPAIQALRHGVNLGREFRVHFHFIGQSMSATAAGGRDTRESFRTRLLARWDKKTWEMLAPGMPFVACPGGPVGIWAHVHGSEVEIIRVPWVSADQAREFVLSGPTAALGPVLPEDIGGAIGGVSRPTVVSVLAPLSEIVSQLPAKRDGTLMSLKALQRVSERRKETGFPEPEQRGTAGQAHLYDVTEVREWFAERERLAEIEA